MALVLAAATAKEMDAVLRFAGGAPAVAPGQEVEWSLDDREFVLSVTGIGVINAALACGRFLARDDVQGVVNLGVAGAFDVRTLPLGTGCLVRREIWPEYGLLCESGVDPRGLGFCLGRVDGEPVWDRVDSPPAAQAKRMGLEASPTLPEVVGLTVSAVTGTRDRARHLAQSFGVDVESMEGFALAYGCARVGVPFLQLRAISNQVGSRAAEDWDLDGALAMLGPLAAGLLMNR